jgi:hypothetical protein
VIDWVYNYVDTSNLIYRLDRLIRGLSDEFVLTDVSLTGAAAGNLIQHGGRAKSVRAQLKGVTPTIGISVGAIDSTYVRVYATAACVCDLYVKTQ